MLSGWPDTDGVRFDNRASVEANMDLGATTDPLQARRWTHFAMVMKNTSRGGTEDADSEPEKGTEGSGKYTIEVYIDGVVLLQLLYEDEVRAAGVWQRNLLLRAMHTHSKGAGTLLPVPKPHCDSCSISWLVPHQPAAILSIAITLSFIGVTKPGRAALRQEPLVAWYRWHAV